MFQHPGPSDYVDDYEISLLPREIANSEPTTLPADPDVEHGIFNEGDLIGAQDLAEFANVILIDTIPNLTVRRLHCGTFAEGFFLSNLLDLPSHNTAQKISFYCSPINVTEMFTALRDKRVLHHMLLLDHVARCVEQEMPVKQQRLHTTMHEYNKDLLQSAIAEYLLTHEDLFLEFLHTEIAPQSQFTMISTILAQVKADIVDAWKDKGGNKVANSMYDSTSKFSAWWAVVSDVLKTASAALDEVLVANNVNSTNLNLLYGFHMTRSANKDRDDITLRAYCEQATGQPFRIIEPVEGEFSFVACIQYYSILICYLLTELILSFSSGQPEHWPMDHERQENSDPCWRAGAHTQAQAAQAAQAQVRGCCDTVIFSQQTFARVRCQEVPRHRLLGQDRS